MFNILPYPANIELLDGEFAFDAEYKKHITASFDDGVTNDEGYILTISDTITIAAKNERGLFYACRTLEQLALAKKTPCMKITDEPRFAHRGFHLDCVRHFFTVSELKKMIDAAALFKFNIFHWHLTDDQGWRIEIKKYPELIKIGSVREMSNFGSVVEPGSYGGWYTQDEIRDVVDYCKKRYIDVIPEIEMPGHTSALLASIAGLSCREGEVKIKTCGGVFPDVLCVSSPRVREVLSDILAEVAELFPYSKMHLGGDEAPQRNWAGCDSCQKYMHEHGLKNESELQALFTQEMADVAAKLGKTAIVWNDALKCGNLSSDVIIQYWLGDAKTAAAHAERGGKIIMSDFFHYYTDYPYGMTPLRKTYNFEPAPKQFASAVIGVEAALWAEHIRDFNRLCYQAYPRMAAVAESGWTRENSRDAASFADRFEGVTQLLLHIGVIPAPRSEWDPRGFGRLKTLFEFLKNGLSVKDGKQMLEQRKQTKKEQKRLKSTK